MGYVTMTDRAYLRPLPTRLARYFLNISHPESHRAPGITVAPGNGLLVQMNFVEWFPYLLVIAKVLLYGVAVVFFISGIDDLFIDIYYGIRGLYRRIFILRKYRPLTEEQLLQVSEQPIAVLIPAWDEAPVIRYMLENTLRAVHYANYHIFVGTYPNDPGTQREVEIVREKVDNVHRIVCPKDGPTNKADCLNWIYQG